MKIEADLTGWPGLEEALETHDVVSFRTPAAGDTYLSLTGSIQNSLNGDRVPRPILKKRSPTDDQVREAVKKALEDIGCVVDGSVKVYPWHTDLWSVGVAIKR